MTRSRRPSRDQMTLREAATSVVSALTSAGHEAYFAGGCVRDRLLGIEPDDYDVATSAHPDDVRTVFPGARGVGESFGVMLVRAGGHMIEVATFRHDGVYRDGRHPDSVTFSDARHDAERRDFTINGLFEDPVDNRVIDFVGGEDDLRAGVLRAIGDPACRFAEDHLRMLRAVRFAARFGFDLDIATAAAIRDGAGSLEGVSRERIGHEVRRMLEHPSRAQAVILLQSLGLDGPTLAGSPWQGDISRLTGLQDEGVDVPLALAGWLLDRGGRAEEARRWRDALVLSNAEFRRLRGILAVREALWQGWQPGGSEDALGVAGRKRLAGNVDFDSGLTLVEIEDAEFGALIRATVMELASTGIAPIPLINGEDLVRAGLHPGPLFSSVLEAVYDAQLEGRVSERAAALALAMELSSE